MEIRNVPLFETEGGAGVIVRPEFCDSACRSRTVSCVNDNESRPMLRSTTSSTSIFSMILFKSNREKVFLKLQMKIVISYY